MSDNHTRQMHGRALLDAYEHMDGVESRAMGADEKQVLSDLLADLMHYAGAENFQAALNTAQMHFEAEDEED